MEEKTIKMNLMGHVQGVGMRFFVHRNAKHYGVKGYVKNKYNGSVECLFQGPEANIREFIRFIRKNAPGYIENYETEDVIYAKKYKNFSIQLF